MSEYRKFAGILLLFFACGCHNAKQGSEISKNQTEASDYTEVLATAKQISAQDVSSSLKIKIREITKKIENPKTADDFFLKAYIAEIDEEKDEAIKYYNKAIELKADYARAYYYAGAIYVGKKDLDKAMDYFKKFLDLKPGYPNNVEACITLAFLSFFKYDYKTADEYFKKIIEYSPNKAEAYYDVGDIYYDRIKNIDKAMEYFKHAVELKPGFAEAYAYLGTISREKEDYGKAIEYYEKAIQLKPDSKTEYTVFNGMGTAYFYKQDFDKAIEYYKKALDLKIGDVDANIYFNIGIAYIKKYDYDKSMEYLKHVVDLDSKHVKAYRTMGNIYSIKRNYAKAIEFYETAIKLNPKVDAYISTGSAYYKKQDYDKALEYFEKAIKYQPEDKAEIYDLISGIYFHRKDYDKAIEYLNKAISLNSAKNLPYAYNNIGEVYFFKQEYDKAIEYTKKAIDLDSNMLESYLYLGEALLKKGNKAKGMEYKMKAVENGYMLQEAKQTPVEELSEYLAAKYKMLAEAIVAPKTVDEFFLKGYVAEINKQQDEAIKYYTQAEAYKNVGDIFKNRKNYSEAAKNYKKAVELNPNYAFTYKYMEDGYFAKDFFVDSRNGKIYKYVKIDKQTWMAENLNYKTGNSWCFDDLKENCDKYGRLYDWNSARSACPAGWHLPSQEEWQAFIDFAGGKDNARAIKAKHGWSRGGGTDEFGFYALPGGFRKYPRFIGMDLQAAWWTASEQEHLDVSAKYVLINQYCSELGYICYDVMFSDAGSKSELGLSVRCVK
ncbi:tetratricopeptide repeat protein [Fibrobacteria bacterium R8-3-H12]